METKVGKSPNIFATGDFNFPGMSSWTPSDMDAAVSKAATRTINAGEIGCVSEQVKKLVEVIKKYALTQVVEVPTRLANILDLIFVNNIDSIDFIETIENILVTDHKMIVAHMNSEVANLKLENRKNFCSTSIPYYNLFRASPSQWKNARNELMNSNLDFEAPISEVTDALIDTLDKIVVKTFNKPAPPKKLGPGSKSIIPRTARTLMRRKVNISRAITKETDETKVAILKVKIATIENELRISVHKMRANQELLARTNLKSAPDILHDYVKKINKKSSRIGPLKRSKDTENLTDAEILSKQYNKVFSTPDPRNIFNDPEAFFTTEPENTSINEDENTPSLLKFTVTEALIKEAIDSLPPKAAPGPDGIPNILIKQLKHEISPILQVIFSKSLETATVPDAFLKAFVKPVKKPLKPRSDPSSYRPLSLTSNLAKVLEKSN